MNDYPLAALLPAVRRVRIPLARDSWMLFMIAINEIFIGLETYLAHSISGTIVQREWIPILFGPISGVFLLAAGVIAMRRRMAANVIGTVVFLASIVVGLLGSYYHVIRAILPDAPFGEQVSLPLLVWAPPMLGPLTFALVGILGLSAAWQEDPVGSGRLVLPGGSYLQMPLSKTRAYFFLIGLGTLITVLSSALDHARSGFVNPWVWVPAAVGVFATTVIIAIGVFDLPTRADLVTCLVTMGLLVLVGLTGALLHVTENLTSQGAFVGERFVRGAPVLAPMLFANMAALGTIILFDPKEGNP